MKSFVSKAASAVPRGRVLFNVQNGGLLKAIDVSKCVRPAPKATKKGENVFGAWSRSSYIASEKNVSKDIKVTLSPEANFPGKITWLAGAPGAGKGTNSVFVGKTLGYSAPTIVMSSLLESPECKRIKDAGGMVDDAVVCRVLLEELAKPQYRQGVVVDGFPRTEQQAAWLKSLHKTASASTSSAPEFNFVMLYINEESSISRQLSRGDVIRKQNIVRAAGGLAPFELRATDTCAKAARTRYCNFIDQYSAVAKHAAAFPFSVVDASAPLEVVQQRLLSSLAPVLPKSNYQVPTTPLSLTMPVSNLAFL